MVMPNRTQQNSPNSLRQCLSLCCFVCYCFKSTPIDTHTDFFLCYCASSQQFTFWKLLIHEKIKSSKAPWRFDEGGTHNAVVFDEQLLRCCASEVNHSKYTFSVCLFAFSPWRFACKWSECHSHKSTRNKKKSYKSCTLDSVREEYNFSDFIL